MKNILNEFDVTTGGVCQHLKKNSKFMLLMSISARKSIVNFYKNIGYLNQTKQERLSFAVKEIFKLLRLDLKENSIVLEKLKRIYGTDKETLNFMNKELSSNYSYRQFEHFRRNESMVPLEIIIFALQKTNHENYLPEWAKFLTNCYLSKEPLINSSTKSLAFEGE